MGHPHLLWEPWLLYRSSTGHGPRTRLRGSGFWLQASVWFSLGLWDVNQLMENKSVSFSTCKASLSIKFSLSNKQISLKFFLKAKKKFLSDIVVECGEGTVRSNLGFSPYRPLALLVWVIVLMRCGCLLVFLMFFLVYSAL